MSLKVKAKYIREVKLAVTRNSYARQQDLAEALGIARQTLSSFLNGKPVSCENFQDICECLALDWREIADFEEDNNKSSQRKKNFIYVERPPIEVQCYEELLRPGALVRIKAPKLMGKTELIKRTFSKIKQNHQEYRAVKIDLKLAEKAILEDLKQFLKWFCRELYSRRLRSGLFERIENSN